MTVHDVAAPDGASPAHHGARATASADSAPEHRRVVRVSRATVAAAYAQANLLTSLGEPVPPAIAKIAALAPSFGSSTRKTDITER